MSNTNYSSEKISHQSVDGGCSEKIEDILKVPESWTNGLRNRASMYKEKLLHNKFAITSKFVVCSKIFSDSIPSRNCDIIALFPANTSTDVVMWVVTRIRSRTPELSVTIKIHSKSGDLGLYLTASHHNLLKGAEELGLRKMLKEEYGGGAKEFVYEERGYFEGVDEEEDDGGKRDAGIVDEEIMTQKKNHDFMRVENDVEYSGGGFVSGFLKSEERQCIVRYMLMNLRAVDGDQVTGVVFHPGQAIVPVLLSKGVLSQVYPLHNNNQLSLLRNKWVRAVFKHQPLDRICDYYGVKIALYFAYLGYYTRCLCWPAVVGVLLWLLSGASQFSDDICFVLFAFFNVIWSMLYLEGWKREESRHAHHWNTIDSEHELLMEPRALYHGDLIRSKVTGRMEASESSWKRTIFKTLVSYPLIGLSLSVVFVTVWLILELQGWINKMVENGACAYFIRFLPKILLAMCISLLDEIYKRLATWLNDKENYRLDITYENNLILKLVMFQSVNSFLSLFYIAFYLQNMTQLQEHLAALLITRQVVGNLKETLQPFLLEKFKLFKSLYAKAKEMDTEEFEEMMKDEKDGDDDDHEYNNKNNNNNIKNNRRVDFDDICEEGQELKKVEEENNNNQNNNNNNNNNNQNNTCNDYKNSNSKHHYSSINDYSNNNNNNDNNDSINVRESHTAMQGGSFSRDHTNVRRKDSMMLDVVERVEFLKRIGRGGNRSVGGRSGGDGCGGKMGQAEVESFMKKYEDTYEDYLEMFIQFGYVSLFSSAFPLAALCALVNNIVEIRSDAFKLCFSLQRPFGQRVQNIGIWQTALELMSVMSIMVNSALIGMSGLAERLFPEWGTAERIVSIVIIEHAVMALRMLVAHMIPDVPEQVLEEKARLEFMRREALKKLKPSSGVCKK